MADDEPRPPVGCDEPQLQRREHLAPRRSLVSPRRRRLAARPRQADDRGPGQGAPVEPGEGHGQPCRRGPWPAAIVVAAHEQQRSRERIAEEPELIQPEVAAADDEVEPAQRLAVRREVERRVVLVGRREDPNRPTVSRGKGPRVRPHQAEPPGHRPPGLPFTSRPGGGSTHEPRLSRPRPAARTWRESSSTLCNAPVAGSCSSMPGMCTCVTEASISSWPPYNATPTRLWPSVIQ